MLKTNARVRRSIEPNAPFVLQLIPRTLSHGVCAHPYVINDFLTQGDIW